MHWNEVDLQLGEEPLGLQAQEQFLGFSFGGESPDLVRTHIRLARVYVFDAPCGDGFDIALRWAVFRGHRVSLVQAASVCTIMRRSCLRICGEAGVRTR